MIESVKASPPVDWQDPLRDVNGALWTAASGYDDSRWRGASLNERNPVPEKRSRVWRIRYQMTAPLQEGERLMLEISHDDNAHVYVDGFKVGEWELHPKPRLVDLSQYAGVGEHALAIRVWNNTGPSSLGAALSVMTADDPKFLVIDSWYYKEVQKGGAARDAAFQAAIRSYESHPKDVSAADYALYAYCFSYPEKLVSARALIKNTDSEGIHLSWYRTIPVLLEYGDLPECQKALEGIVGGQRETWSAINCQRQFEVCRGNLGAAAQLFDREEKCSSRNVKESAIILKYRMNLLRIYLEIDQVEKAQNYLPRIAAEAQSTGAFPQYSADVYLLLGDYKTAEDFARRSYREDRLVGSRSLSKVFLATGDLKSAQLFCEEAYDTASTKEPAVPKEMVATARDLALICSQTNDKEGLHKWVALANLTADPEIPSFTKTDLVDRQLTRLQIAINLNLKDRLKEEADSAAAGVRERFSRTSSNLDCREVLPALANAYAKLGDQAQAEIYAKAVIAAYGDVQLPENQYVLSGAKHILGQDEEAKKHLRRAMLLGPGNKRYEDRAKELRLQ